MKKTLLTFFLGLFTLLLHAQSTLVKATLDTNEILIGDQVKLTLSAQHAPGVRVSFPLLKDSIGKIEIVSIGKIDTAKEANQSTLIESQTFVITGFDSGYYVVPPFPILSSQNQKTDTLLTDPLAFGVHTLPVDTAQAIKEIKGPLDVPFTWRDAVPYVLGAVILAALIFGIYYWLKKRKRKLATEAPKAPARPAHEIALEQLRQLEEEKVWQQGDNKTYHIRLTDIIRLYLENRYNIAAMEQTTDEILASCRSIAMSQELKEKLQVMLTLADLVKFAKVQSLPDENTRSMQDAYLLVQETRKTEQNDKV